MYRLLAFVSVALSSFSAGLVTQSSVNVDKITAQEIVLTSPNGDRKVSIVANDTIAGVFVESKSTGRVVRMYDHEGYGSVGIIYPGECADRISISSWDHDRTGVIQLHGKDKIDHISVR